MQSEKVTDSIVSYQEILKKKFLKYDSEEYSKDYISGLEQKIDVGFSILNSGISLFKEHGNIPKLTKRRKGLLKKYERLNTEKKKRNSIGKISKDLDILVSEVHTMYHIENLMPLRETNKYIPIRGPGGELIGKRLPPELHDPEVDDDE